MKENFLQMEKNLFISKKKKQNAYEMMIHDDILHIETIFLSFQITIKENDGQC